MKLVMFINSNINLTFDKNFPIKYTTVNDVEGISALLKNQLIEWGINPSNALREGVKINLKKMEKLYGELCISLRKKKSQKRFNNEV